MNMSEEKTNGLGEPFDHNVFEAFPKLYRLRRGICITEKIDGTNAQVCISEDLSVVRAGSRSRWITPEDDNYGFARWVAEHAEELKALGPGRHYGEWWGQGIQRRYGMTEKRFSLFNTGRWLTNEARPACCHVVPLLYAGPNTDAAIDAALEDLRVNGSKAAPGFAKPEGVVVFHTATRLMTKITCEKDEISKAQAAMQEAAE